MTKQANKTAKKHDEGIPLPFAGMAGLNGGMFESYAQASQSFFEHAFALNQELIRFAGERLQADMTALQTMSQFKDFQDIASFQAEFTQSAVESYQAEIAKLMEQTTEAASAAWKPLQDTAPAVSKRTTQD